MEVKLGYKMSVVGLVPEDWRVVRLSEVMSFKNGLNANRSSYGRGTRFINVLEVITLTEIGETDIPGKVMITSSQEIDFRVETGDVVFNRTSETLEDVGLASIYVGNESVVFGGFVIRGRSKPDVFSTRFLPLMLRTRAIHTQIVSKGQGGIRANISQKSLEQVQTIIPPLTEQQAIANALGDADASIESLDQLIAKKRQLNQGVMQQLLTGKQRLPGFTVAWEYKRLDDISDIYGGGTPSTGTARFWQGSIPWCTPTDITALKQRTELRGTSRTISPLGLASNSAEMIPIGSVIMTTRATIGECAMNVVPVSTNQGFKSFVPNDETCAKFLYYLLTTQKVALTDLCAGSTFLEIGKAELKKFEILVPPTLSEQRAIAQVLSDLDAEITALTARRDKAKLIKQGMMQELLTGKTRLA